MGVTNLGQLLLRAFRWMDDSLRATLEVRGWPQITPAQSLLFANLDAEGTRTSELARRLGVSRQAVHQTVRELERLGFVEQIPDPTNASAKLVCLTEAGRHNVAAALQAFQDLEAVLAQRIGEGRMASLRAVLERDWGDPIAVED